MKSRFWVLPILATVSLLILATAACDDDDDDDEDGGGGAATTAASDDLTLYFQDLAAIQEDLNEGVNTVGEQSDAVDPAQARQALNAVSAAGQDAFSQLQEMDVPAEASDDHAALEDAAEAYLSEVDALADELQNIGAGEEFETWQTDVESADSEYSQAKAGLQEACADLAALAEENNVAVEVDCPV